VNSFVQLRDGRTASEELANELKRRVRTRHVHYQYPGDDKFVSELPMTTAGKFNCRELRKQSTWRG